MARMQGRLDIHSYDRQYAQAEQLVRHGALSDRNKELIIGFRDACLLRNVCGRVRLIRVMGALGTFARLTPKNFDEFCRPDVEALLGKLLARQPPYSPETLGTYKAIIKSFLTWVLAPNTFPTADPPEAVAWLRCHVRARDKRRLERSDLLVPEDIKNLLGVCRNPRDKALVSIFWETGGRIAEIGNEQLKNVQKTTHGYILALQGKTGLRNVMIVSSAPYLTVWLNNHPFKDDPESPVWVHYQYSTTPRHLQYPTIRSLLAHLFRRAGIKKPFHPHVFRHSRVTYVLANGIMNEQQAKAYFGWTPESDMLGTYSHLIDQDANNAILRENNLTPAQQRARELQPISCRICTELNPAKSEYCTKCGAVLDLTRAYEHQQLHDLKENLIMRVFRVLVEKGLVDEAAREVHEGHLGETLRRLAQHERGAERISATPSRPPGEVPIPAVLT